MFLRFHHWKFRHDKTLTDHIGKTNKILTIILLKIDKKLSHHIHRVHSIIMFYLFFLLGFKLQHTMESLNDKKENRKIRESEITEEALVMLLEITVFMIKENIAYTHNYEDFVKFIENDLEDKVLSKYLSIAECHKNANVTTNTVKQFVNVINIWMREKTLQTIKSFNYLTFTLDESPDESNRSELSLIFRIVNKRIVENHFLDLMQLQKSDVETFLKSFKIKLSDSGVEIQRIKFAGWMDAQRSQMNTMA